MILRPAKFPEFARITEYIADKNTNTVVEPNEEKKDKGWKFKEKPGFNVMNWLHRVTYEWLKYLEEQAGRMVQTNGNGVDLFPLDNCPVELIAVNTTTPSQYLRAVGYKAAGSAVALTVTNSSTLTLGTPTGRNQPIAGASASNIIVTARSYKVY